MSGNCNATDLPYFEVHADNEIRYNRPTISYLKAVHVHVHMVKISILKGGVVQVRDRGEFVNTIRFSIIVFWYSSTVCL